MNEGFPTTRRALLVWAELAGLWTLIFAQQAFQRIASGPEAFTQVGADRLDVMLLVILVVLLPPTLIWLLEMSIYRWRSAEAARIFHAFVFGAAIGLFCWQLAVAHQLPLPLRYLPAAVLAGSGTWLYLNTRVVKQFAELISLATPVVVALFVFTSPTSAQILPSRPASPIAKVKSRTPVVLVVLDELSLESLLDREGRIDARLFPNFARLARRSTWYPQARGASASTVRAVPTVMSGRLPRSDTDPLLSSGPLPDNLCDLLERGGYRIHAVETITRFCGTRHSRPDRLRTMLSRTLVDGIVPPEEFLPEISNEVVAPPPGPIPAFAEGRAEEFDGFIDSIPDEARTFSFAHPMLPHRRWMYMPDGSTFAPDPDPWALRRPQRDFLFQQVMLQIGSVDRQLGRLFARMKARGIWNDSLLVVTADHGLNMTFRGQAEDLPETGKPTWDSRDLTRDNAGTLLPIPLFVKFPGQRHGEINRAEVTSADIAPTVLSELGVELPDRNRLDGRPLQEALPDRIEPIRALSRVGNLTVPRAAYTDARRAATRLRQRLFGGGTFYAPGGRPDLIDSPVGSHPELRALGGTAEPVPADPGEETPGPTAGRWLFRLAAPLPDSASAVVIAVNGTVVATAKPWLNRNTGRWTAGIILPRSAFRSAGNEVTLHAIPQRH